MKSHIHLLPFIAVIVAAFASVTKTEARATKHIELKDDSKYYALLVDKDEEDRLSELLQHDFAELGVIGTYTTHPPYACPRCGKETEFIDWVFTALERGVHTREWLVEAMRDGRSSKKTAHDVYCSRCGHLTAFQDYSGEEGGVLDVSHANQYDHAAKSFGYQVHKREEPVPARRDEAAWFIAGGKFGWEVKRETAPDAVLKRAEELASDELTGDAPLPPQCAPRISWNIKRDKAPDYVVKHADGLAQED